MRVKPLFWLRQLHTTTPPPPNPTWRKKENIHIEMMGTALDSIMGMGMGSGWSAEELMDIISTMGMIVLEDIA